MPGVLRFCVIGWSGLILILGLLGCGSRSDTVVSIALHPTKPNILYVATDEAVYKSSDTGATWQRLADDLSRTRVISLAVDPVLPANVFAGTMGDGTYKSSDGGRTWHQFNEGIQKGTISAIVNHLVFNPLGTEMIYAATTVGVFRSMDGGRTWKERMNGMNEVSFVVTLAIDPQRPNVLFAGTTGGVYRTTNATETWEKKTTGMVAFDAKMASMALGVNGIVIDPTNSDIVYAGTTKGLYKSMDQGEHWTKIEGSIADSYVSAIQFDPVKPSVLYLATSDRVQKSEDSGATWQPMTTGLDATSIRSLQVSPQDSRILYVGTNGGGLYRSLNGGETWARLPLTPAVEKEM
ncbi:MAG: WD40/YVTN/BNR-like repeat-containing protein [Nitrospirales bacterium]